MVRRGSSAGAASCTRWRRPRGPSASAPEWWRRTGEAERDYYVVEDTGGRRFWLLPRTASTAAVRRSRNGSCMGCSHDRLCRADRCHQLLVPARRLAPARDGRPGGRAETGRHRHCRPQYAGGRRARAHGRQGSRHPPAGRRASRHHATGSRRSAIRPTAPPMAACAGCSRSATGGRIKGQCHFSFEEMLADSQRADLHRHSAPAARAGLCRALGRPGRLRARPRLSRGHVRLSRRRAPPSRRAG